MRWQRATLEGVQPMPRGKAVAVAALAAAVVAIGVVAEHEGTAGPQPPLALGLAIGVAAGAVTAWRARAVPVAIAVVVLCVAYHLLGFPGLAPAVALYPVLYTMAATGCGLRSIALPVAVIVVVVPIPLVPPQAVAPGWANVGFGASLLAIVAFGEATRARRQAAAEQLRAVRLAGEQETRRQIAEDRVAVAREVHDVLAHTITAISVQAAAAAEALDDRPEDARAALVAVRGATRDAMAELRGTLGTLRNEPSQGIDQLPQLEAQAQAAGLAVTLTVTGGPEAPAPVERAVYRIVQEALTNTVRHAAASRATVTVAIGPDAVAVEVTDDGRGGPHTEGHGLCGMRERAAALGGTLEAGARGHGFRVAARLPTGVRA
jgi:signal transduction histidine kinase